MQSGPCELLWGLAKGIHFTGRLCWSGTCSGSCSWNFRWCACCSSWAIWPQQCCSFGRVQFERCRNGLCYVGNLVVNTVAHIKPKLPVEMKQIIIYNQVMQHGNYYYINIRFTWFKSIMKFSSSNMHLKVCLQNLLPNTPSKVCLKL